MVIPAALPPLLGRTVGGGVGAGVLVARITHGCTRLKMVSAEPTAVLTVFTLGHHGLVGVEGGMPHMPVLG